MSQAPQVPAWKRLGLKLKYAKEDVVQASPVTETKNKSDPAKVNGTNGYQKGDLNRPSSPPPPPLSNGSGTHTNGHMDGPPPTKKQKRVSFSADTKLLDGDGDGASTARSATPSELANAASSGTNAATDLANQATNLTNPATAASTPKPKPSKKAKTRPTPPSKHKSQNMLDYLHQYYNNNSNWKFQKNREVWILKHLFSTEDIPTKDYGLALAQYVHGLKSEGARKRLTQEAEEKLALTSTTETAEQDSSTEHPREQLQRLREILASFPEKITAALGDESDHHHTVLAQISRPLLILTALHPESDDYPKARPAGGFTSTPKQLETKAQSASAEATKHKKRKNRTTVIDYSSSSSSESESDSDSDSDEKAKVLNHPDDDETSSSGSSGSSSDSDSDSDSASE